MDGSVVLMEGSAVLMEGSAVVMEGSVVPDKIDSSDNRLEEGDGSVGSVISSSLSLSLLFTDNPSTKEAMSMSSEELEKIDDEDEIIDHDVDSSMLVRS